MYDDKIIPAGIVFPAGIFLHSSDKNAKLAYMSIIMNYEL